MSSDLCFAANLHQRDLASSQAMERCVGKYRKKPVVIDAFKWTGGPDQTEDPEWIVDAIASGRVLFTNVGTENVRMHIGTLEGVMMAIPGDFIILGVANEIYPCKPDIFEATYEAVGA